MVTGEGLCRALIACQALMWASVGAHTMYKYRVNGKIEYSDKACFNSNEISASHLTVARLQRTRQRGH